MAKKKGGSSEARAVRAAWQKVRQALSRAESSMAALVQANRGLVQALGKAGASVTKNARADLDARVRKLDVSRQNARKQLDVLTKRLIALAKRKKTKAKPRKK